MSRGLRQVPLTLKPLMEDNTGAISVLFAASVVVVVAMLAVAIDYASWSNRHEELQHLADGASLAAAHVFDDPNPATEKAEQVALSFIDSNSRQQGEASASVSTNLANQTVQVTLRDQGHRYFSGLLLKHAANISVSATAHASPPAKGTTPGPGASATPLCILALDPSMQGAFEASGGSKVIAEDCTVQVNSTDLRAVNFSGNSTLTSGQNCFVGGVSQGLALMTPAPTPGCTAMADPFETYIAPPIDPCTFTNFKVSGGNPVLSPGVYCGGIALSSVTTATMLPGLYIVKDGLFTISGGGHLEGEEVAIMLAGSGAGLNWSGGGSYHLVAPSSGDLAGFVVYLDHDAVPAAKSVISGTGAMYYEGIVYLAGQKVEISGTGLTSAEVSPWSLYIANNFLYSGGSELAVKSDRSKTIAYIPEELGGTSSGNSIALTR